MPFIGLSQTEKRQLEMEVVPAETRLKLTRLIRDRCSSRESAYELVWTARFVNMANHVMNRQIYELESDEWGEDYPHAAYAIIESERELIMRRPTTVELAEILADYLQAGILELRAVNDLLKEANCGFVFRKHETADDRISISIKIISVSDIADADLSRDHPNIRVLVDRMDRALTDADYPAVLHSSASIFETLAKDVVNNPKIQNKTLASFFDAYRKESKLPDPLLDYVLQVYQDRNTKPLAGHGSVSPPKIAEREAVVLAELTKAIVRSERRLALADDKDT
jgi:hypothetical protein